jgi:hypothetical protein
MFNNNSRDSAALDAYITGANSYRAAAVIARCIMKHEWRTVMVEDMGTTEYELNECPTCGGEVEDYEYPEDDV